MRHSRFKVSAAGSNQHAKLVGQAGKESPQLIRRKLIDVGWYHAPRALHHELHQESANQNQWQILDAIHGARRVRSEEHTSELQSHLNLVCRLLLEKKKKSTKSTA